MYLSICIFVYLYLGNERVVVGERIVDVISFQKIFVLCGPKCHIMEVGMVGCHVCGRSCI